MSSQYEFTEPQNKQIADLSGKMAFVGLFLMVVGVVNLVVALLAVVAVYRGQLPAEWVAKSKEYIAKLPEEARKKAEEYSLEKIPRANLWAIAFNAGVIAVFYLLMGAWTRTAAAEFRKIVDTQGSDINHLMGALSALHNMYHLIYTLLVVVLLMGVLALAMTLWQQFAA